jgi:hypothetical protein
MSVETKFWCDSCRGHFDREHYSGKKHRRGYDYGPIGVTMQREVDLKKRIRDLEDELNKAYRSIDTLLHFGAHAPTCRISFVDDSCTCGYLKTRADADALLDDARHVSGYVS